jgi:2,3,4,5-tetrahydropyridine-2-carboxylate N-succinyltransferase
MKPDHFTDLRQSIERFANGVPAGEDAAARTAFERLKAGLNAGTIRAAERGPQGVWQVNQWVKAGILLGFRLGKVVPAASGGPIPFFDKDTYPVQRLTVSAGVRVVPGGSAVRDGCHLGRGVVCMPPMYVNVGAYVDEGTMIDSHALVGSCAQVGKRVHLSAGTQLGGVLEPVGALPVIVEDDVMIGGNCGIYEGTIIREGAVLAAGTILTGAMVLYDLVRDCVYRAEGGRPLEVPTGAVVVPGSRPVRSEPGLRQGLQLYTPVIVKYRDEKTELSTRLEELLR